jgi:hypothetical protein
MSKKKKTTRMPSKPSKRPAAQSKLSGRIFTSRTRNPAVVTFGSGAWKVVAVLLDTDFLLLLQDDQMASLFDWTIQYGWIFVLIGGLAWWIEEIIRQRDVGHSPSFTQSVLSIGSVFFVLGIIVASTYLSGKPYLITGHGRQIAGDIAYCPATVNMKRLKNYADDYRLVLICGPRDFNQDMMTDERVHFSTTHTIYGTSRAMVSEVSPEETKAFRQFNTWWFKIALMPKGVNRRSYKTLQDIQNVNGILLPEESGVVQ